MFGNSAAAACVSNLSGTAPEQVLTQDCSGDGNEIQNLEESTEGSEACDSAQVRSWKIIQNKYKRQIRYTAV